MVSGAGLRGRAAPDAGPDLPRERRQASVDYRDAGLASDARATGAAGPRHPRRRLGFSAGKQQQDRSNRFSVRQSRFAPQKTEFDVSWKRFPVVMKPQRERFVTEMTTTLVTVPRAALARWRAAMGLMGLGLGTSGAGLAWDFYVHEIVRNVGEVESIFATPHLVIITGLGITALGFLLSLIAVRFRAQRPVNPA